jgi:putative ABC transport system permease protein
MKPDYFLLAIKNLRRKKLRSSLTVIGILISIATIFILISLSIGLNNAVNEQFRLLGTDKFFISPKGQAGAPGSGGAVELTTKDVNVIEKVNGVKDISYYTAGNAKIEFGNQARYYMIVGIPLDKSQVYMEIGTIKADEGRLLKSGDSGKIIIGSAYKLNNLFKKPVKAGDTFILNGKDFRIVGILKTQGNSQDDSLIYLSIDDFKSLFNSGERVDQIIIQIKSGENIKNVADNVKRKLMSFRNVKEKTMDFTILTPEELLRSFGTVLNVITAFLLGVAGISLLVGAIGIANTMYTSVLERTKEIGVMKAIGAKNSDILSLFVIESGLLGMVGGVIGVLIGMGVGKIIEYIAINQLKTNLLQVAMPWYLSVGCLLFAFLIGSLSGLMPALQASKLKPADTLRYE